jgi:RimJ/RimL family protein N-acetyltransferase
VIDLKKIESMDYKFENIIEGEFITLKKVVLEDAPDIYRWRISQSGKFLRHVPNYSIESQIEWIKNRDHSEINYIIFKKNTDIKVGMVAIYDVNNNDLVADVGRLLLSEEYLKKSTPYGLESLLLTYDFVFNKMNFRKICGDILAPNTEMFNLQKFLGMQQEGYLKQHVIINNKCNDLFIMSLFKEDFDGYKKKINFFLKSFRK